jgi:glycosyltransferase involved in cell wall biosynthesis
LVETIKLLQLGKHFFPDTGGIETVTQSISEMLPAHGIQADVLCTATRADYPPFDPPYRVIRCRPTVRFGRNKNVSLEYIRQVRALRDDYDVALIHMPNPVAVLAACVYWKGPIIQLWHADIPQRPIRMLSAPLDHALLRRTAAVIGPTRVHLETSYRASALLPRGVVIGYPFDRSRLPAPTGKSAVAERVRAFAGARKMALSIGRLVPYKGFDMLIEAARSFDDKLVSVIVGGGPLLEELGAMIETAGVQDRVLLTGPIDDAALADLLDFAFMGCMPSVTAAEMYGVAQVEAMAFGKPVVSTRLERSGVPYVNKHDVTGLVVKPGDPQALAAALLRLVDEPALYRRLADGAAASFAADHDIGPIGQAYAALIRRVVADARAAGGAQARPPVRPSAKPVADL